LEKVQGPALGLLRPLTDGATATGGLCGSIFLDMSFEKHILTLVAESKYSEIRPADTRRMMKMFELGVKRSFTLESNKDYSVELIGVEDNPDEGIQGAMIDLKRYMPSSQLFVVSFLIDYV
jgi:hypothetical protein